MNWRSSFSSVQGFVRHHLNWGFVVVVVVSRIQWEVVGSPNFFQNPRYTLLACPPVSWWSVRIVCPFGDEEQCWNLVGFPLLRADFSRICTWSADRDQRWLWSGSRGVALFLWYRFRRVSSNLSCILAGNESIWLSNQLLTRLCQILFVRIYI